MPTVCACVCVYDLDVRVGELVFCNARKQLCESVWSKGEGIGQCFIFPGVSRLVKKNEKKVGGPRCDRQSTAGSG